MNMADKKSPCYGCGTQRCYFDCDEKIEYNNKHGLKSYTESEWLENGETEEGFNTDRANPIVGALKKEIKKMRGGIMKCDIKPCPYRLVGPVSNCSHMYNDDSCTLRKYVLDLKTKLEEKEALEKSFHVCGTCRAYLICDKLDSNANRANQVLYKCDDWENGIEERE